MSGLDAALVPDLDSPSSFEDSDLNVFSWSDLGIFFRGADSKLSFLFLEGKQLSNLKQLLTVV